jgi:hypothetical protein
MLGLVEVNVGPVPGNVVKTGPMLIRVDKVDANRFTSEYE